MVATGLNLLPATNPALTVPQAPTAFTQNEDADTTTPDSHSFAHMVKQSSDTPHRSDTPKTRDRNDTAKANANPTSGTRTARKDTAAKSDAKTDPKAAATSDAKQPDADASHADATDALNHVVTPSDATQLLANFDTVSANLADAGLSTAQQQQFKTQLQQIVDTGAPATIGDLIAAQQSALVPTTSTPIQIANVVSKLLPKPPVQAAQTHEAQPSISIASGLSPLLMNLQASIQPVATAPTPQTNTVTTADASVPSITVTEITPLSQQVSTLPAPSTPAPAADNDAITVSDTPARPSIDTLIPSLTLTAQKPALPAITLPGAAPAAATDTTPDAPVVAADFASQLQALTGNAPSQNANGAAIAAIAPADPKTADVKTTATITDALNTTMVGGGAATMTANAIAPTSGVAGQNLLNHAPVTDQVQVAITQASHDGIGHITIQLSPGDLGRVEVKMHTTSDGQTNISFLVDKPETFDALSRDARSLEHSLQEAGIKADTSGMQFNLRQQPQPQFQSNLDSGQGQFKQASAALPDQPATSSTTPAAATAALTRHYQVNVRDGVDIHV